jgi:hypothetical protein
MLIGTDTSVEASSPHLEWIGDVDFYLKLKAIPPKEGSGNAG